MTDEAGLQEVELSAAVYLAFDELELGDLPLRLTVRPTRSDGAKLALGIATDRQMETVFRDVWGECSRLLTDTTVREIVGAQLKIMPIAQA